MAVEEKVCNLNLEASGDLSSHQYKFVTQSGTAKRVALTALAGGPAIGVLQNEPDAAGRAAQVAISGRVKVYAGATIAAGAKVASTAAGLATNAEGGDSVLGTAVGAGASGSVMEIVLSPEGQGLVPFPVTVHYSGTVGDSLVKAMESLEFPRDVVLLSGFVNAQAAPSSTYNCDIIITDGVTPKTIQLQTTSTTAEDKAINQAYAADTDIDVTMQDDNASATTAGVTVVYWFRFSE